MTHGAAGPCRPPCTSWRETNVNKPISRARVLASGLACGMLALAALPAQAAEFSLYLNCTGKVTAGGKSSDAKLNLALRDNNRTALIQASDVLPVGERLNYVASELAYSMTYKTPVRGSRYYYDWWNGAMFVIHPNLKKLATTRLSVDRQTAVLEGEMLNVEGEVLGNIRMECVPKSMDDAPAPKF
jgi:hypothetical protein